MKGITATGGLARRLSAGLAAWALVGCGGGPGSSLDADAELGRYMGTYERGGEEVVVRSMDGRRQLLPPLGTGPIDLIPTGPHTFVHGVVHQGAVTKLYVPDERLVFALDECGRPTGVQVVGDSGVLETGTVVGR